MKDSYCTVFKQATAEIRVKKSRFIASVKPVTNEEEATAFIDDIKKMYWDARHNVYAYSIGTDAVIQRYSDDGEPQGTAGIPVLEVIKRTDINDIAIIVTRYFGGVLLGASGLVRAYGKVASAGIENAKVVRRLLCASMDMRVRYTFSGKLDNALMEGGFYILETSYSDEVRIKVGVPVAKIHSFVDIVNEITNANVSMERGKNIYITVSKKGVLLTPASC
jgi:uncharacterized YigZ family protein